MEEENGWAVKRVQRVQMAGHRLTDPVLSGSPQNLNPPQVLSAPQPSSSEPGRGLCVDQCAGFHCDAMAPARLLPLSITLSSTIHPSTLPYNCTSDHGIGFPRTKPLTPYLTAPCMAINSCLTALPKLCHRHHWRATNPPPGH